MGSGIQLVYHCVDFASKSLGRHDRPIDKPVVLSIY